MFKMLGYQGSDEGNGGICHFMNDRVSRIVLEKTGERLGTWLEAVLPLSSTGEAWRTSDDRHAKTA